MSIATIRKGTMYKKQTVALIVEMARHPRPLPVAFVADRLSKSRGAVSQQLKNLERKSRVRCIRTGVYELTDIGRRDAEAFKAQSPPPPSPTVVRKADGPAEEFRNTGHTLTFDPESARHVDEAFRSLAGKTDWESRYWSLLESYQRLALAVALGREGGRNVPD